MAINTDAPHATDVLRERHALQSTEFGDTQKLLDMSEKELKRELNQTPSDAPLDKSLEAENNEQTVLNIASEEPRSPSSGEDEPCCYAWLWVAVISCFCPAVPINLFSLYFAHMARSMIQSKDYEGGRRLGRLAMLLGVVSIIVGLSIFLYLIITELMKPR